jgi:uncharacterized protein YlxW (UPF0749 family)
MIPVKFWLVGSAVSWVIAGMAFISQQEAVAWAGVVSAIILLFLPVFQKIRSVWREEGKADREARRGDCEEKLRELQLKNDQLQERIHDLECRSAGWESLFKSGSSDHPKIG